MVFFCPRIGGAPGLATVDGGRSEPGAFPESALNGKLFLASNCINENALRIHLRLPDNGPALSRQIGYTGLEEKPGISIDVDYPVLVASDFDIDRNDVVIFIVTYPDGPYRAHHSIVSSIVFMPPASPDGTHNPSPPATNNAQK